MSDFWNAHFKEILAFITGLAGGGVTGSFFTYRATKNVRVDSGSYIDLSKSQANRDIVGGNKIEK